MSLAWVVKYILTIKIKNENYLGVPKMYDFYHINLVDIHENISENVYIFDFCESYDEWKQFPLFENIYPCFLR